MDRKDYIERRPGGWAILTWDEGRGIYVEPLIRYRTKRDAQESMREQRERNAAAAILGRKGGQAGRGASQRRVHGSPEQVSARMREVRAKARKITVAQYGTDSRMGHDDAGQAYISHRTPTGKWSRWMPATLVPR